MHTPFLNSETVLQQAKLTEEEANNRKFANVVYELELELTDEQVFKGKVVINFSAAQAVSFLDFAGKSISYFELNGSQLGQDYLKANWKNHKITLQELAVQNRLVIHFEAAYSNTGFGLYKQNADAQTYIYSLFCPNHAHTAFPCFDQPDIKAQFLLKVCTLPKWQVVSNVGVKQLHKGEILDEWYFDVTFLMSTYLFCICAGDWTRVEAQLTQSPVPMSLYCKMSNAPLIIDELVEAINFGIKYYESLFNIPYPFQKYDHIICPHLQHGAMEHPGAVLVTNGYFHSKLNQSRRTCLFTTILHELSHMWFGNLGKFFFILVTMKWWNDVWLNEAFAVYISYRCLKEFIIGQESRFDNVDTAFWAYRQDGILADIAKHTHPIEVSIREASEGQEAFDNITYRKGAAVVAELAEQFGFDNFLQGVRDYMIIHKWGNADSADFFGAMEKVGNQKLDIKRWRSEWTQTPSLSVVHSDGRTIFQKPYDSNYNVIRQININLMLIKDLKMIGKHQYFLNSSQMDVKLGDFDALITNYDNQSYYISDLDEKTLKYVMANFNQLQLDITTKSQLLNIFFQMCLATNKIPFKEFARFTVEVILNDIHQDVQLAQFAIQSLSEVYACLSHSQIIRIGPLIFERMLTLLQQIVYGQDLMMGNIRQLAGIIFDYIGKFVTSEKEVPVLYELVTSPDYNQICHSNRLKSEFLLALFNFKHRFQNWQELPMFDYWNKSLKQINPDYQYIEEGTLIQDFEGYFEDLLANYQVIDMVKIQKQFLGLRNHFSPNYEKYEEAYFQYLPKVLNTQNRHLIRIFLNIGLPKQGKAEMHTKQLKPYLQWEQASLIQKIYEQYDLALIRQRVQLTAHVDI